MSRLHQRLLGFVLPLAVSPLFAVSLSQFNVTYSENFDTLALTTSSVMPPGWEFSESGSGANTTYSASTGSSTTGNTYSFGGSSSTDRAIGSVRTSSLASTIGTVVTNDTGNVITQLTVQFTGEQWRLGALGRVDRFDFGISVDATSVATGTWLDVDELDFTAPVTTGTVGALDGDAAQNQLLISHTLTGLSLAPGASLWLRWVDFEASGSDDGLGIDNFSLTATQTDGGGGGGGAQPVPENLPLPAVFAIMTALCVAGSRWGKPLAV